MIAQPLVDAPPRGIVTAAAAVTRTAREIHRLFMNEDLTQKDEKQDLSRDRDMAEIRRSLRAIETMLEELVERSREQAESFARSEH